MPLLPNIIGWLLLRTVAGFASALVFVVAVNSMLDHLPPHLPGWGFGGVGLGIALSGALVLTMPAVTVPLRPNGEPIAMTESPMRDRMWVFTVQGEDVPQATNRIDLDPSVRDVYGSPAGRVIQRL